MTELVKLFAHRYTDRYTPYLKSIRPCSASCGRCSSLSSPRRRSQRFSCSASVRTNPKSSRTARQARNSEVVHASLCRRRELGLGARRLRRRRPRALRASQRRAMSDGVTIERGTCTGKAFVVTHICIMCVQRPADARRPRRKKMSDDEDGGEDVPPASRRRVTRRCPDRGSTSRWRRTKIGVLAIQGRLQHAALVKRAPEGDRGSARSQLSVPRIDRSRGVDDDGEHRASIRIV